MKLFWHSQIILLALFTSSCSNQFNYKKHKWKQVSQTSKGNPTTVYLDENRTRFEDGKAKAWVKFIFGKEKLIPFSGSKKGEVSGSMKVKRMDSSVEYNCESRLAQIVSYQLYNAKDEMFDAKWIDFEPEYARKGTIHGDILDSLCK